MNEIANFFLPLTFGHIFWVALIIIAAIVCARIALAVAIWVFGLIVAVLGSVLVGIASIFSRPKKRHSRR